MATEATNSSLDRLVAAALILGQTLWKKQARGQALSPLEASLVEARLGYLREVGIAPPGKEETP